MEFSRPEHWSGQPFPSPGDLPNLGTEPRSPTLQVYSLPTEPQEKPKNTGVGSLSLLQGIFLTQELNQGLLHCRQILSQLIYQGSLIDPLLSIKCGQCCYRVQNHAGKIGLVICFCRGQDLRRFQGGIPWTVWKGKKIWHWKINSPGW